MEETEKASNGDHGKTGKTFVSVRKNRTAEVWKWNSLESYYATM